MICPNFKFARIEKSIHNDFDNVKARICFTRKKNLVYSKILETKDFGTKITEEFVNNDHNPAMGPPKETLVQF